MTDYINRFRPSRAEIDRRYANVRAAMEKEGLDALVVSGSEYTGFEGAVRYMCGFVILHRYATWSSPPRATLFAYSPGKQPGWETIPPPL